MTKAIASARKGPAYIIEAKAAHAEWETALRELVAAYDDGPVGPFTDADWDKWRPRFDTAWTTARALCRQPSTEPGE